MTMNKCKCNIPDGGFCARHNIQKNAHWVHLCHNKPVYFIAWEEGRGPGQEKKQSAGISKTQKSRRLIGDQIEQALTAVGITSDRVSKFIGRPCGCHERKERLNRLYAWAIRVMGGHVEEGKKDIEEMLNE